MIIVKQDSELMKNYIAANPIPSGERFAVFGDERGEPAVLALGEDSRLNLIVRVGDSMEKIDFAQQVLKLPLTVKVQAFAVKQAQDLTLDICIATEASSTKSDFWLLYSIKAGDLLKDIPSSKIIKGYFPTVRHFFLSTRATSNSSVLPLVMVSFQRPDRIANTEDLRYVNFQGSEATLYGSWDLATNPKRILDVALVTCALGDAAFVLYEGFEVSRILQTKFFKGDLVGMAIQPPCPAGATCLSSFMDPRTSSTVAIIGGATVTAFQPRDYISPKGKGTVIDTKEKLEALGNIECSQTGDELRIWYTTSNNAVHYYTAKINALSDGVLMPLLADGHGGRISPMLSLRRRENKDSALVSSLISVDQHGNLILLQQDSALQIWQQYPLWHASSQNVIEVQGYTLRMQAVLSKDAANDDSDLESLIPGCSLYVSSSGTVRCIINGRPVTLTPTPQWLQCDTKGTLTIVLQTQDTTCHRFAAERFRSVDRTVERPVGDPILDPSKKLVTKLEGVDSPAAVRALRKPDGTPLVPSNASEEDVKAASDAIQVLIDQTKEIHRTDQQRSQMHMALMHMEGSDMVTPFGIFDWVDDVGDWLEGAWNWLEEKIESAWNWGCELIADAAGKVWKFIVHIGEEIWEIVLDTVAAIVKGITWVFKKLGALIQDIIDFLGFLFGWGDILDTTDSIATSFNVALDHGQDKLASTGVKVETWLEDLRKTIKEQLPKLSNYDYRQEGNVLETKTTKSAVPLTVTAEQSDEMETNVTYNWGNDQFMYGGGPGNAYLDEGDTLSTQDSDQDLVDMWNSIQDILTTITGTVANLAKDLISFLLPGGYDAGKLLNQIAEHTIDGMIDAAKSLAAMLFKALESGIGMVRSLVNHRFKVPVLGWLWEHVIAPGRPLTLLNFCSLLLAIPTTILYKATKKVAPPKLKNRLTKATFSDYLSGRGDAGLARDIRPFSAASNSAVVLVGGTFETLGLLVDGTFEGLGLELIPIGPIDDILNVVDSMSMTLNTVGAFNEFPDEKSSSRSGDGGMHTEAFDLEQFCKYSGYALKISSFAANTIVKKIAKKKGASRMALKRYKGTVKAVVSVPRLFIGLTEGVIQADAGEKETVLIVNKFIGEVLKFGKAWGEAVAAWNNEVENPVMYGGLAVAQGCTVAEYALKVADFVIEQGSSKAAGVRKIESEQQAKPMAAARSNGGTFVANGASHLRKFLIAPKSHSIDLVLTSG